MPVPVLVLADFFLHALYLHKSQVTLGSYIIQMYTAKLVCSALVRLKVRGKVALLHFQELLFFRSLIVKLQM